MSLHEQEIISSFEAQHTENLLSRLKEQLIAEHPSGIMPRDAHPKMHGLVEAVFTVHDHLPDAYQLGVFAEPKTFKTWIRFSNANGPAQPDAKRDIRGIAIKLLNAAGDDLSTESDGLGSQDFLLISTDVFLCADVQTFDGMIKAVQGSVWQKLSFFVRHPGVVWRLIGSFKTFANPLQIRYFSSTPYLLGQQAVKYCLTPVVNRADAMPENPGDDFLRAAMRRQLSTAPAEFVFGIQLQTNPQSMPVEDASIRWDEAVSPFIPVATLHIPTQDFDTPARNREGEDMRFSPWHCLAVHRPLGGINRARRLVYHGISELRRRVNGVP